MSSLTSVLGQESGKRARLPLGAEVDDPEAVPITGRNAEREAHEPRRRGGCEAKGCNLLS